MNFEDVVERIGWGEEFLFKYKGEEYWISQNSYGRYLTKVSGSKTQQFATTQELIKKARVEGETLIEIWDDIKIYF